MAAATTTNFSFKRAPRPLFVDSTLDMSVYIVHTNRERRMMLKKLQPVWPNWTICCTLCNFFKPLATIILPKLPTFLGIFIGVKILIFLVKTIWGNFFLDIWRLFTGHTGCNTAATIIVERTKERYYFAFVLYWTNEMMRRKRKRILSMRADRDSSKDIPRS